MWPFKGRGDCSTRDRLASVDDRLSRVESHLAVILRKLDAITAGQKTIIQRESDMAGELDNLKAAVAREATVLASAKALLIQLKAKLDAAIANGDMGQVQALSDQINADLDGLAKAVTDNTPAAGP